MLFDATAPWKINLAGRQLSGRFPSDEQQLERFLRTRIVRTQFRQSVHEAELSDRVADREMVNGLFPGGSVDFVEASEILKHLWAVEPMRAEARPDGTWVVDMNPCRQFACSHSFRPPSIEDFYELRSAFRLACREERQGPRTVVRYKSQPLDDFYRRWALDASGYRGPVPFIHRVAAAGALSIEAAERLEIEVMRWPMITSADENEAHAEVGYASP